MTGRRGRRLLGRAAWSLSGKAREAPEELFMSFLVLLSGLALLLGSPKPESLEFLLPHWLLVAWAGCLTVGGFLVCLGMFRRGFAAELAGLTLLAWTCPAYALVIFAFAGWHGVLSIALLLAYAGACGWRAHTVSRGLRRVGDDAR